MNQLKVGIFLFFGLLTIIVSIFFLGSNKSFFQSNIKIYSYFDSVQGLNKGAIVSLAGVKIGNVDSIEFDEIQNLVKATFLVQEDYQNKIKTDSIVEIKTQGALGDKFIYITPGKSGTTISAEQELKGEFGNDILSILSKRGSDSEKLFDAITDFQKLIYSITSQNKIPSLIARLDQTAGHLSAASAHMDKALSTGKLEKAVDRLDNILEKIDNGQGTLGALINDKSVHDRIKGILGAGQKQQQVRSILKTSIED